VGIPGIAKSLTSVTLLLTPGFLSGQNDTPLTTKEKAEIRFWRIVNPMSVLGSTTGAAIEQWRDHPPEWGQGGAGYARRVGAGFGWITTQNMLGLLVDTKLHLDPRFRHSEKAGIWDRAWDAMVQNFVAYKDSGGRTINYSEFVGSYGAGFMSDAWYPAGSRGAGDALVRGTIGLGFNTMSNVAKEFWPDIKRLGREKILHRKP
jgi:hypothetical protein